MEKYRVDPLDVEVLASKITGLDYDEIDADTSIIENELIEQFGCDLDQFTQIIGRLIPLIDVGESPLTKKTYKGFADRENHVWLIKTEV